MDKLQIIDSQIKYWSNLYEHVLAHKRHDIKEIKEEYDYWKLELNKIIKQSNTPEEIRDIITDNDGLLIDTWNLCHFLSTITK